MVLLRKSTNVFKPWKPVLAILTVDNFLHLFDVPQTAASVALGSSAREAMSALVPRPDSVNKASGLPVSPRSLVTNQKDAQKKALGEWPEACKRVKESHTIPSALQKARETDVCCM